MNRGCYAKLENDKETIESRKTNAYITSLLESIEKYNDHKEQQLHKESVDAAAVCFLRSCEKNKGLFIDRDRTRDKEKDRHKTS